MGVTYGDRMELELPLEMKSIALGTCVLDVHPIWIKALLQILKLFWARNNIMSRENVRKKTSCDHLIND
jgi:hypothetical protein